MVVKQTNKITQEVKDNDWQNFTIFRNTILQRSLYPKGIPMGRDKEKLTDRGSLAP